MKRALFSFAIIFMMATVEFTTAAPVVRQGTGAKAAGLQATVDQFRTDLGGALNPSNGQSFTTGRREVNWDGAHPFGLPTDIPVQGAAH